MTPSFPPKVITPDMYAPAPEVEEAAKVPFKRIRVMPTTTPRTTPRPDAEVFVTDMRFSVFHKA